jgi:Protein of unknown function (DUF1592)/Protein of unknown function (DUF1588)/Protein of unknown function (DUF1595)/Protein of unknown function (DUF1585)/Protein of unknown function (DUF1587)
MFLRIAGTTALVAVLACTGQISQSSDRGGPPAVDPILAVESGVRRLSQSELDNTLRDLLGEDSAPAARLLNEDEFRPFDNDYTIQQASAALITSLEALADEVAARAVADTGRRAALVPCTPSTPGDEQCFRAFLAAFLPKAFRRAVTEADIDAYLPLLAFASEDNAVVDNDFYTAVRLAIAAALQDPEFLYRVEQGTPGNTQGLLELDGYEIANRMSYLLWASMPDDALFAAAAAGTLRSSEGRRGEALRMLDDPKARAQLHRFHAMWLGYRSIPHTPELVAAFDRETSALIDRVILDEPGSYLRLFTMDETFIDDSLADHYGLPRPSNGEGWVPYDGTGRAGILGHGSLLAAFSKFEDTSPTQRGILVRTRFMCEEVPRPPPTVDTDQPPKGGMDAVCKYERYAEHRDQSSSCAGCHSLVDPIGFGLENYDVAGRYREHDDGLPECTIEGSGEIVGIGSFSGPSELSRLLVDNGYVDACAVQQFLTFALGRPASSYEAGLLQEMVASFRAGQHDFKAFVVDFAASDRFARRAEERL